MVIVCALGCATKVSVALRRIGGVLAEERRRYALDLADPSSKVEVAVDAG